MRRLSRRATLIGLGATIASAALARPASASAPSGGVFADAAELAAARRRPDGLARLVGRAEGAARLPIRPFVLSDPAALRFGWREAEAGPDDTLKEAVDRLTRAGDAMRTLALAFALTGSRAHGARAEALMAAWAREHTVVNVHDHGPDFAAGTLAGGTRGFGSDRPWNLALDAMWQAYGAINAADALLLLRHGGWPLSAEANERLEGWLRRLLAGVNSSLHAWTHWADANPGGTADFHDPALPAPDRGVRRHRSDNHLTWALAGLLAGAAALGDDRIAAYALDGAVWDDGRSGPYANPSPLPAVLGRAIEMEPSARGRIHEERIGRDPPLGYALFHLEAMTLAGRVAGRWFDHSVWGSPALLAAYRRYGAVLRGERPAPGGDGAPNARWLAALTPPDFGGAARGALLEARALPAHMEHAIGPARLLFGPGAG